MTTVLLGERSNCSCIFASNCAGESTLSLSMYTGVLKPTPIMIWAFSSGFFGGFDVVGSWTAGPFCSMGVTTMKMIRSTRTTSTSGVTLISDFTASALTTLCMRSFVLLQEEVHELRGGV